MGLHESCGVFVISSSDTTTNIVEDLFLGIFGLQHRGTQYCGLSTCEDGVLRLRTHRGLVRETFTEDLLGLGGSEGIGHVSLNDRQPLRVNSQLGEFTICFSGNIINAKELTARFMRSGECFSTDKDVEIIAKLIAKGSGFMDGIQSMARETVGSYSLAILSKDGIFVARDKHGYKPFVIGQKDGVLAVSSESCVFENLGMMLVRDVKPGEIIHIKDGKMKTETFINSDDTAYCPFEWVYVAEMGSTIEGVSVAKVRRKLGACLARRYPVQADLVAPVPNSGIGHAIGYVHESGIPYNLVLIKSGFAGRSYTQPTQEAREREARVKLTVVRADVEGQRIILCDDSIVRGTQMRSDLILRLRDAGAKEIHVRIACPPLLSPCPFGKSTRSKDELIAAHLDVEGICKYIGADSLGFNTIKDLETSIGFSKSQMCTACWQA